VCKVALYISTPVNIKRLVKCHRVVTQLQLINIIIIIIITWLQSPTEGMSVEEHVKVIRKIENGKRREPTCVGIWSHKFYDRNDLAKQNANY